jgi:hypothetical protein
VASKRIRAMCRRETRDTYRWGVVCYDSDVPKKSYRLDPGQIEVLDDAMAEILRNKTGAERLRISSNMFSMARRMVLSRLRSEHPDWDQTAINREAARRLSRGAV